MEQLIKSKIREVPDWPKAGVNFKDITPLLEDGQAFKQIIDSLAARYLDQKIDKIVGIDARGFLIAAPLAYKLDTGIAIVRKKGKLPAETVFQEYDLEYGSNVIEMHKDSIAAGEKVLLVDDVLATGGTMRAAIDLVEKLKGEIVAIEFLIELSFLNGRAKLGGHNIKAMAKYDQ